METKGLYIESYGCQMNIYDSLMMEDILRPVGFSVIKQPECADIIVVNTCHIREKASEKLYSTLGRLRRLRKEGCVLIVAGCVAQAEGEAVFERAPFVDVVVGPQSIHTLSELIMKVKRDRKQINIEFPVISKFDAVCIERKANAGVSAFVSVQEGCDKFCTFCVVPYTRGPEYSRTVEAVFDEVQELADKGAKEVVLIGQNVNAYHGTYMGEEWNLGRLIQKIATIGSIERIRYTTSHPMDMHPCLYEAHRDVLKLAPFVHLPVQCGSNTVLRRMNRKHTVDKYLSVIDKLRAARSDIAFSSDFIVGFPGESDQDFEETVELVKTVGFASAYSFKYSPRPGTPGAEYPDQVAEEEKRVRLSRLQALLNEQQLLFNRGMVGKVTQVLVGDEKEMRNGRVFGKSPYAQSVRIAVSPESKGCFKQIVEVKVTDGHQATLEGILLNSDTVRQPSAQTDVCIHN